MSRTFGNTAPVVIKQPYEWCAKIVLPDGSEVGIEIEMEAGKPVILIRAEDALSVYPVASNTIGIKVFR